mgnify:CR=1 FL=1
MPPHVTALYRYPVKGLSPEPLERVTLEPGGTMPADRAWAIENGSRDVDPEAPRYFPKTKFLMLMKNERLAALDTRYDDATHILTIHRKTPQGSRQVASGDLSTPVGRQMIEQFIAAWMADDLRGAPRLVTAPDFSFSDVPMKVLSLINLESVRDLERVTGSAIDPLRFRANVHVEGIPAWAELDWEGRAIRLGGIEARGELRTRRCAATNVNPDTAERDMNLPQALRLAFGHMDMGIYLSVTQGGTLAAGDTLDAPA